MPSLVRSLGVIGLIATAFGLASYQVLDEWNPFNVANLVAGGVLIVVGGIQALLDLRSRTHSADTGPTVDALLMALSITW